jgi:hypothetical protein
MPMYGLGALRAKLSSKKKEDQDEADQDDQTTKVTDCVVVKTSFFLPIHCIRFFKKSSSKPLPGLVYQHYFLRSRGVRTIPRKSLTKNGIHQRNHKIIV